ncbi:MAG: phosphoserine phosphatase SerB [Acidimicrobiia bacterium]|nr:MAG: phosphoserine phosphatase SerB [Acidimicrobiia bacterium]
MPGRCFAGAHEMVAGLAIPCGAMTDRSVVLVSVHGPDRPGITASLMEVLSATGADIYDVEQIVVRGRLTLNVLVGVPGERATIRDLLLFGWDNDLHLEFEVLDEAPSPTHSMAIVTLIGVAVGPVEFGAVAAAVAGGGGNIERIYRLSKYPVVSYELVISSGDLDEIRAGLVEAAAGLPIDVAIQPDGLLRRAKRIMVMDVDSTLVEDEVIDLLADEAGVGDRVAGLTAAAMAGEIDFEQSLRRRVEMLEGLDEAALARVADKISLTKGARTFIRTVKRLGMVTAVVSAGFSQFTDAVAEELGIEYSLSNTLEVVDGRLTGRLSEEIVDGAAKARFLRSVAEAEGVPLSQVVAVGDGANDLEMLAAAGLGIAFNAKSVVSDSADAALTVPYLDAILFLMGVRREHVDAADAGDADFDQQALIDVPGTPPI